MKSNQKYSKEIIQFAEITQRVIAKDGFEEFLPTAMYPQKRLIKTLVGLPGNVDIESATIEWAKKDNSIDEEFMVAFRLDEKHFKIIHHKDSKLVEAVFDVKIAE